LLGGAGAATQKITAHAMASTRTVPGAIEFPGAWLGRDAGMRGEGDAHRRSGSAVLPWLST
jgi:hypothetical protein